jgi:hypothetical protein
MKYTFYSFHDSVTNGYSNPFLQQNRAQAIRTAKWKADESKLQEIEDISLVEMGEFNSETGEMYGAEPKQLYKLVDLKKEYGNGKS